MFRDGYCIRLAEGLDGVYKFHLHLVEEVFKLLFATIGFRESRDGVTKVGAEAMPIRIGFIRFLHFMPRVDIGCVIRRACNLDGAEWTSGGHINHAFAKNHSLRQTWIFDFLK